MLKRLLIASLLIAALAVPLALHAQDDNLPELILAARAGYHPEGVDWDAEHGVFVTGSLTEGGVFTIADDGTVTPLAASAEGLASTGVHVDAERNRVLVAMPDFSATQNPDAPGAAALGAYDLDTGEELFFADLSELDEGRDFANDVTVDSDGNAYVTTSFSGVIYVVDTEGNGDIFLATDDFSVEGFGLNGIDYHPDGNFLLVAVSGAGAIYKVPVDDPDAYSQVMLDVPVSIDGMVLGDDGLLYAVASVDGAQTREVVVLSSDDDWATASIVSQQETQADLSPTTLALRDGAAYVVHAKFSSIGSDPAVDTFEIQRFTFDDMTMGGETTMSGAELVDTRCTVCHTRERIDNATKTEAEWTETVDRMIGYGAVLNEAERAAVIDYLAHGMSAPTGGDQGSAGSCTFAVEVTSANLRVGPGTGYGVVGYALQDEQLSVVGISSSSAWLRVQTADGEAWIAASVGSFEQECVGLPVSSEAEIIGGSDNDNTGDDNSNDNAGNDNIGTGNSNDNDDNGNDNDDDDNGNDNDD